jgi:hypothetical protein
LTRLRPLRRGSGRRLLRNGQRRTHACECEKRNPRNEKKQRRLYNVSHMQRLKHSDYGTMPFS